MSTKYRAQILLEPEQHAALAEAAGQENRSISDLVREIVGLWLEQQNRQNQIRDGLQALEELNELRHRLMEEHGIYAGNLIEEAREEQDSEGDRVRRGEA